MFWMEVSTYRLPERPMVTTRINEAVPITIPERGQGEANLIQTKRVDGQQHDLAKRDALGTTNSRVMYSSISQEYQGNPNRYQANAGPTLRADALAQKDYRPARTGDITQRSNRNHETYIKKRQRTQQERQRHQ